MACMSFCDLPCPPSFPDMLPPPSMPIMDSGAKFNMDIMIRRMESIRAELDKMKIEEKLLSPNFICHDKVNKKQIDTPRDRKESGYSEKASNSETPILIIALAIFGVLVLASLVLVFILRRRFLSKASSKSQVSKSTLHFTTNSQTCGPLLCTTPDGRVTADPSMYQKRNKELMVLDHLTNTCCQFQSDSHSSMTPSPISKGHSPLGTSTSCFETCGVKTAKTDQELFPSLNIFKALRWQPDIDLKVGFPSYSTNTNSTRISHFTPDLLHDTHVQVKDNGAVVTEIADAGLSLSPRHRVKTESVTLPNSPRTVPRMGRAAVALGHHGSVSRV